MFTLEQKQEANELLEKWALALESGNYKQGQHCLAQIVDSNLSNIKYCCLGVLCEVSDLVIKLPLQAEEKTFCFHVDNYEYDFQCFIPHNAVWSEKFYFPVSIGELDYYKELMDLYRLKSLPKNRVDTFTEVQAFLSFLNDASKISISFSEIAQFVRLLKYKLN